MIIHAAQPTWSSLQLTGQADFWHPTGFEQPVITDRDLRPEDAPGDVQLVVLATASLDVQCAKQSSVQRVTRRNRSICLQLG